jgi:hypothetical protein
MAERRTHERDDGLRKGRSFVYFSENGALTALWSERHDPKALLEADSGRFLP